jgi:hypothetical protein
VCQQQLDQHGKREPGERVGDGDHGHLIPAHPAPDRVPAPCPRPAVGPPRRTRTIITALLDLQLLAHATLPLQLQLFPGYGPWIIGIQAVSLVFETSTSYLLWRTLRRAPSLRYSPAGRAGGPPPGTRHFR